jgi:hypothetical protein
MQENGFKDSCRFCLVSGSGDKIDIDDCMRKKYQEITSLEVNKKS